MDWAATPLGPPESWPRSLKTCVRILLTSRQAMFVWWGDHLINLHNDAYRSILGGKHPWALGQPASAVWREIWDQVGPRAESAMHGNEGTYDEALLLLMERNGYREETYYTFSYSPVPNDEGGTGGIICANTDDTQRIVGGRQLALLQELAARASEARTIEDACVRSIQALETNRRDLPFAMIYLTDPATGRATLAGASGIEPGHPAAPLEVELERVVVRLAAGRGHLRQRHHRRAGSSRRDSAICPVATGTSRRRGRWRCRSLRPASPAAPVCWSPVSTRTGCSTKATRASCRWSRGRSRRPSAMRRLTRRSAGAPRRWPRSTAPRRPFSAMSAMSSAPR